MDQKIIESYRKYLKLERNLSNSRVNLHIEVLQTFAQFIELEEMKIEFSSRVDEVKLENHGGC